MTQEEKDRLIEILFYLYFNNKDSKILSSSLFWNAITAICTLYGINNRAVVQAVRVLMAEENSPTDEEAFYLLDKIGLTVRPIRKISGIYWQKQRDFKLAFETKPPVVKRRITDVIYKKSIRDFIYAMYDITGMFADVPKELLGD